MVSLIQRLEQARKNPRRFNYRATSDGEVEIDWDTFYELRAAGISRGGYFNNIGSRIKNYKHVLFVDGVSYTVETGRKVN